MMMPALPTGYDVPAPAPAYHSTSSPGATPQTAAPRLPQPATNEQKHQPDDPHQPHQQQHPDQSDVHKQHQQHALETQPLLSVGLDRGINSSEGSINRDPASSPASPMSPNAYVVQLTDADYNSGIHVGGLAKCCYKCSTQCCAPGVGRPCNELAQLACKRVFV